LHRHSCSIAAVAIATSALVPASAFAKQHSGGSSHVSSHSTSHSVNRSSSKSVKSFKSVSTSNAQSDHKGASGYHYSHRRHYWHGRWWTYGVGPCWVYNDDYDEYRWTCGDNDEAVPASPTRYTRLRRSRRGLLHIGPAIQLCRRRMVLCRPRFSVVPWARRKGRP